MKRPILLIAVLFSFLTSALADNILLLTNPKSKETNVFRKGSYLVFELKADNSVHEGFIQGITDSSIVFDDSQVSLSQINIFAGRTKARIVAGHVANAVGNTLLFAGTSVFDCGTSLILNSEYYYWPLGGAVWAVGGCIAVVGYAFDWAISPRDHALRVRNYREWNASIVIEGQPQIINKQNVQIPDSTQTSPSPVDPKKERRKKSKITEDDVYGN
jgi:hypothetical protein